MLRFAAVLFAAALSVSPPPAAAQAPAAPKVAAPAAPRVAAPATPRVAPVAPPEFPAPLPPVTLLPVPVVVDAFEDAAPWSAIAADGVSLALRADEGVHGRSLRLDYDFHGGGGYAVAHRKVSLELPANWRFTFRLKGDGPPNNLEFKLLDASGDNVWWCNTRDLEFPRDWSDRTIRRREVTFAWGPQGGGEPKQVAAIEFAVSAGQGGRGSLWLDDLELQPLPPPDTTVHAPVARASSERPGRAAALAADAAAATSWASAESDSAPWFELDLGAERELGGVVLDWAPGEHAADYDVLLSSGSGWTTAARVRGGNGGRDWVSLPGREARFVRVGATRRPGARGVALAGVAPRPLAWSASPNDFLRAVAQDSPRGAWPRAMRGELAYWTVVGQDFDAAEGLIDEYGRLESGKGAWSVEPFLRAGGRLLTWADMKASPSLADGCLPVPSVDLSAADLRLRVTAFATGEPGRSSLVARYHVRNAGRRPVTAALLLALRPFQVNPPSQFLNTTGGYAPLRSLALDAPVVRANGDGGLVCLTRPAAFGATTFASGEISEWLREGRLPPWSAVTDSAALASGALEYPLSLAPGEEREVAIEIPLHGRPVPRVFAGDAEAAAWAARAQREAEDAWRARLGKVTIELPDSAMDVVNALKAQLGWVLVNRDGPAIQPGSRSYERSWIRDGCLTSSALLRLGETEAVRQFVEWFAPFQYANGKVPCCADHRGADPVPEHDSHGELVYLIATYTRYTGDLAFAGRMWPHVTAAIGWLDTLRAQRRGPAWRTPENIRFYGMLPPSISHEGYSAKPMHSYWDDLFALRGYKDAAWLAAALGRPERAHYEAERDTFERDLVASYRATMRDKGIDWLAGCADMGDFDATSTSIALEPVNAEGALPDTALRRTFERYWENFERRRDGREAWDAFTPYEWRNVGAFVRLGWKDRAQEALAWFMGCRRPKGFQHWAEVVWNGERRANFIGDMPHTWVGTDFARTVLDLFAYEQERDSSLVLAAGVPDAWLRGSGVTVRGLRTRWGPVAYTLRRERADGARERVVLRIEESGLRVPPGGLRLPLPPLPAGWSTRAASTVCASPVTLAPVLTVRALPAEVTWEGTAPAGRGRR